MLAPDLQTISAYDPRLLEPLADMARGMLAAVKWYESQGIYPPGYEPKPETAQEQENDDGKREKDAPADDAR